MKKNNSRKYITITVMLITLLTMFAGTIMQFMR